MVSAWPCSQLDQQFPPADQPALAAAHSIATALYDVAQLQEQPGDTYPLVVRLETVTDEGRAQVRPNFAAWPCVA